MDVISEFEQKPLYRQSLVTSLVSVIVDAYYYNKTYARVGIAFGREHNVRFC